MWWDCRTRDSFAVYSDYGGPYKDYEYYELLQGREWYQNRWHSLFAILRKLA